MSARRAAPAVLAALVIAHAAANFILVRAHPSDVIQFPHHYIIQAYEAARGADIRYPITYDRNDLFFRFAAPWVRAFGESPVVARLTTTAYWLAALVLAFLAGLAAKDARAGLIAALALAAMDFPNTYSRGFDVHVPRMMWELAVLAPLFASFRPGWRWAAAAAAVAPALGAGFSPSISDAPLFFLGVSGAAGAWVLWQAIRLSERRPRYLGYLGAGAAVVFVAVLFHPDVQLDYLRGQSFGGAEDASSVGAAALLALHLSAYPVFLVGAGMGLFASAIVIPGVVLACAKWRTSWPVLLGAAVPLALLTVVAKKNGYYAGIVMPPLAVAAGMGLADTVAARRFLWAPIAAVALAGTAAVWMRAPTQVLPRAYDTVFQYKGLFNYRAEPLPPFAQRAVRALSETVDEACGDRPRCHIGIVGELPNEMEIVLPAVSRYPAAEVRIILDGQMPENRVGEDDALILVTSAFAPDPPAIPSDPMPLALVQGPSDALADALRQAAARSSRADTFRPETGAFLHKALAGMRHARRVDALDYFVRDASETGAP